MATNAFQGFSQPASAQSTTPTFGLFGNGTSTWNANTTLRANATLPLPPPAFGSAFGTATPTTPAPVFGSGTSTPAFAVATATPQPTSASNNGGSDKGQILQCLNESKNVQLAILHELQQVAQKLNAPPQQPTFPLSSFTTSHTTPKTVHTNVFCNACMKNNITGDRYKCLFCKDFDLCEECEAKPYGTLHDSTHIFIKIKDTNSFLATMEKKPTLFNAAA